MTRRSLIKSLIEEQLATANSPTSAARDAAPQPAPQRTLAGPVRTMGLTLDKIEDEARALQAALAQGQAVVELAAGLIDPSFLLDRFDTGDDAAFEQLKASIRDHGQEVPVLVRPHPAGNGRFQLAYGHRRWRAARDLGLPLRAVVRAFDDQALILAQGLENSARKDLSYIERAMFARSLEERGTDRQVIMVALSTDKTELSKMISVARAIPETIARSIGPAPKAGRRRWLDLAEQLKDRRAVARAEALLADPDLATESDVRFLRVLSALSRPRQTTPQPMPASGQGRALASLGEEGGRAVMRFEADLPKGFSDFVAARLGALFDEFQRRKAR